MAKDNTKSLCVQIDKDIYDSYKILCVKEGKTLKDSIAGLMREEITKKEKEGVMKLNG